MAHESMPDITPNKSPAQAVRAVEALNSTGSISSNTQCPDGGKTPESERRDNTLATRSTVVSADALLGDLRKQNSEREEEETVKPPNRIIDAPLFRYGIMFAIFANSVQMGLEVQIFDHPWDVVWQTFEYFFTVLFFIEMVIKLFFLGKDYFLDPSERLWNILDFIVVWVSITDICISSAVPDGKVDIGVFRALRLMRLARVAKIMKMKPELMMIIEGIVTALQSMVWLSVLLSIIVYTIAIASVRIIGYSEDYKDWDNERFFGNLVKAMLTLMDIAFKKEWHRIMRPIGYTQPFMVPLFSLFFIFVSFGILNSIIGIIVQKTSEAAKRADKEKLDASRAQQFENAGAIAEMMFSIDTDGDGNITQEELIANASDPKLMEMLKEIAVPESFTVADLHTMLDIDGDGDLTQQEFVAGMWDLVYSNDFQRQCLILLANAKQKRLVRALQQQVDSVLQHELELTKKSLEELQAERAHRGASAGGAAQGNAVAGGCEMVCPVCGTRSSLRRGSLRSTANAQTWQDSDPAPPKASQPPLPDSPQRSMPLTEDCEILPSTLGGGTSVMSEADPKKVVPAFEDLHGMPPPGGTSSAPVSPVISSSRAEGLALSELRREHDSMKAMAAEAEAKAKPFRLIDLPIFTRAITVGIALNSLQMGMEVQFLGEPWESIWQVCEYIFTIFFFGEMVIKLYYMRGDYFCDPQERSWNILDFVVVWVSVTDLVIQLAFPEDSSEIGVLRALRLMRLARIVKVLKLKKELIMILEGIRAALRSMFWLSFLLIMIFYVSGIFCVRTVGQSDAYRNSDWDNDEHFGTLFRALLTLVNITFGAEWAPVVKPISECQLYIIPFFYAFLGFVAFGVLNSIIGIIVQRTTQAARAADAAALERSRQAQFTVASNMSDILFHIDDDGDGLISEEELAKAASDPKLLDMLKTVDVPKTFTVADLHLMLDKDGDGELTQEEFTQGVKDLVFADAFQRQCLMLRNNAVQRNQLIALGKDIRTALEDAFSMIRRGTGHGGGDGEDNNGKEVSPDDPLSKDFLHGVLESSPKETQALFQENGFQLPGAILAHADTASTEFYDAVREWRNNDPDQMDDDAPIAPMWC